MSKLERKKWAKLTTAERAESLAQGPLDQSTGLAWGICTTRQALREGGHGTSPHVAA